MILKNNTAEWELVILFVIIECVLLGCVFGLGSTVWGVIVFISTLIVALYVTHVHRNKYGL